MGISPEKRMLLAKLTAELPNLSGISDQEVRLATKHRREILELVFDRFIKPDGAAPRLSATNPWKRARQLWKSLLVEKRASYFNDLKVSHYVEWIEKGGAFVLPCTTDEIEERSTGLPEIKGSLEDVRLAKEIRATLMKHSDEIEQRLLEKGVPSEERRKLEMFRDILRKVERADWFLRRQPEDFTRYENLFRKLVEEPTPGR